MIQTIKSSDKYYKFIDYGADHIDSTSNCAYRSLEVSNLTNLGIDWGMVFVNRNILKNSPEIPKEKSESYNYVNTFTYHVWNFNDENIFDSQFQIDELVKEGHLRHEFNQPLIGSSAVVIDASYLGTIVPNTPSKRKLFRKELRNYLYKGSKTGADIIYLSGCAWDGSIGLFIGNDKEWNEEMDLVELRINNFKKNLAVSK